MYSDEEEGEYRMMQQQHRWNRGGPGTSLSVEFEELQWPPRFIPAILPQYDRDSDPREFLLSTKPQSKQLEEASPARSKPSFSP